MSTAHQNVLDASRAALVIVDVQEAFRPTISAFERMVWRIVIVARAARLLGLPILLTEQYPQKLGASVAEIRTLLPENLAAIEKTTFSSCGADAFCRELQATGRTQIMLAGIETHVCLSQTAHDLLTRGYQVHLLVDCTSSRRPEDREIGWAKMFRSGALPSTSEMAVFELLRDARHEQFKAIHQLIK